MSNTQIDRTIAALDKSLAGEFTPETAAAAISDPKVATAIMDRAAANYLAGGGLIGHVDRTRTIQAVHATYVALRTGLIFEGRESATRKATDDQITMTEWLERFGFETTTDDKGNARSKGASTGSNWKTLGMAWLDLGIVPGSDLWVTLSGKTLAGVPKVIGKAAEVARAGGSVEVARQAVVDAVALATAPPPPALTVPTAPAVVTPEGEVVTPEVTESPAALGLVGDTDSTPSASDVCEQAVKTLTDNWSVLSEDKRAELAASLALLIG